MPSYKGHLVGGVVTYLCMLQCIKYSQPSVHVVVQGFVFCMLGSLFPDIDVKSKGQKIFYTQLLAFLLYCLWYQKIKLFMLFSFLAIAPLLSKHRGIFHSIAFLLLITVVCLAVIHTCCVNHSDLLQINVWFFFAGAVSHVLLDRVGSWLKKKKIEV